jgi:FkbM family methyltransferase
MVSYGQNHEDVLLRRAFPDGIDGFYIDVGAQCPHWDSVTKHFYDRGWRGINIEPQTEYHERLCVHRENDINLNVALSRCEVTLELHEFPSNASSTLSPSLVKFWRDQGLDCVKRSVPVTTLARVCEDLVDKPIDFVKIDVEGHEREVIEGGDWRRWRPRVILIEAMWPDQWEHLILAADYLFAIFDGINRYYVRAEDRQLLSAFSAPVNFLDDYIPYKYVFRIDELSAELGRCNDLGDLGPNAIGIAVALHRIATRFPTLSSAFKRITRLSA